MNIKIVYFAVFKDKVGKPYEHIDFSGKTAEDLFQYISKRYEFLDSFHSCKIAVNNIIVEWKHELCENDEVLLFPPVAGG
jgi:molybdopterin converting factor subunit 1